MHGRVKSIERKNEQQKTDEQRQEEVSRVRMYHEVASKVLAMKRQQLYEHSALPLTSHLLLLNPEFHMLWSYRRQVITALVQETDQAASKLREMAETELKMTLVRCVMECGAYVALRRDARLTLLRVTGRTAAEPQILLGLVPAQVDH